LVYSGLESGSQEFENTPRATKHWAVFDHQNSFKPLFEGFKAWKKFHGFGKIPGPGKIFPASSPLFGPFIKGEDWALERIGQNQDQSRWRKNRRRRLSGFSRPGLPRKKLPRRFITCWRAPNGRRSCPSELVSNLPSRKPAVTTKT